jgi:hypothetical protein|tara:strand:+ start:1658 stop:2809 length:1152 start_codon:yes stop_codon:yes gene_type:complete
MIKIIIFLSYIFIFFNNNLLAEEKNNELKIGLLAPFTGEYKYLGESLLLSVQLALDEIGDKNIKIIPRDSGSNDKDKINISIKEIIGTGAKVIIGPTDSENFKELVKYKDTVFISLSNKNPKIEENIISIGISLESQLEAIKQFLKKQKKNKTIIIFPKNEYKNFIDEKIKKIKFQNFKIYNYDSDPKILTGEIEKITNYSQRKRNLELRKQLLQDRDDAASKRELDLLEQRYTLGNVNFDSIVIIDFGSSLKSVLTSLIFSDVSDEEILFSTVNQWFDESIFYENSVKNLYYPSVNLKNYNRYKNQYKSNFNREAGELGILAYDALGLIYYVWKKNEGNISINNFLIKEEIKGKIGKFKLENNQVLQELKIYKTQNRSFKEF